MSGEPLNLAVLVSGSGTTLQNLLDQIAVGKLHARVSVVVGSKPDILGLLRAERAGIPSYLVQRSKHEALPSFSQEVFAHCDRYTPDLICLAGWLSLLAIPSKYAGRVMNIHPALLPSFGGRGMFGRRVHQAVIGHGCKVSGCTVHFVDDAYDTGPIILQRTCVVEDDDTPETLAHRVFEEEKIAYPEAIRLFQAGRLKVEERRVRVTKD